MLFTPPYPFTWSSPVARMGHPSIGPFGSFNPSGQLSFGMSTDLSNPSSAFLITSFAMDAGIPRDPVTGRPLRVRSELQIVPTISYTGYFYSGGVFASALTSAIVAIYVEERDSLGNFVRGIDGSQFEIVRENPWWFSGSQTWTPFAQNNTVTTELAPIDRRIFAQPNFSYRVFIDLRGEIQAAGYGGIGGSFAHANCQVTLNSVVTFFNTMI